MKQFAGLCIILAILMAVLIEYVAAEPQFGIARVMRFDNATEGTLEKRRGRGTWYNGKDLRNAACYGQNGLARWDATPHDMIGAMAMHDREECYKCVKITNNKNKHLSTVVMIVDKCAACKVGKAIDLTPNAFQHISPHKDLDIGVLDISWERVPCPKNLHLPKRPKGL